MSDKNNKPRSVKEILTKILETKIHKPLSEDSGAVDFNKILDNYADPTHPYITGIDAALLSATIDLYLAFNEATPKQALQASAIAFKAIANLHKKLDTLIETVNKQKETTNE